MGAFAKTVIKAIFLLFIIDGCTLARQSEKAVHNFQIQYKIMPPLTPKKYSDTFMYKLLSGHPELFDAILKKKDEYGVQIIYTQIPLFGLHMMWIS